VDGWGVDGWRGLSQSLSVAHPSIHPPIRPQAASMVPEYLTPLNGGLLSPGQMAAVTHAVCTRMAGE